MKSGGKSLGKRLLFDVAIIGVVVALVVGEILFAWAVPIGDFDTVHPVPRISGVIHPIVPEKQVEKHTCGWHAVAEIYRGYGLDPVEWRLRQRLGVDNQSFLYDATTTGCVHPDIYRVMTQDGFVCRSLDLADKGSRAALVKQLDGGQFALALIKRRENGNMHWVVICGRKDGSVLVCDSLKPEIYAEGLDDYWNKRLLSVILISASEVKQKVPVWRLHVSGVRDMYGAFCLR